MVGLHNLYWYYGTQRIKMNMNGHTVFVYAAEAFQGYVISVLNPFQSDLEVIKLEFILKLKMKHNDWLLADACPQAANHCALF